MTIVLTSMEYVLNIEALVSINYFFAIKFETDPKWMHTIRCPY